ncbi:Fic/DOC family protein [Inquilinus sp. OTU3971]|uniref:Fic/DOC family protein n=1 Tax=Inquilinus sp. OTU3971 TaxID=3043855 RepID=UPI00313DC0D6
MYEASEDPYCYPGTTVLINKLNIREQDRLQEFEAEITRERSGDPIPITRPAVKRFQAVHRHLFQDVYAWAGKFRTVRISKGGNMFCYPEQIESQLAALFRWLGDRQFLRGLSADEFSVDAAHFLAELNAIHAFRDGNGRAQLAFMALVAAYAGHPLDFGLLVPDPFLSAMIESFAGDERLLASQLRMMLPAA